MQRSSVVLCRLSCKKSSLKASDLVPHLQPTVLLPYPPTQSSERGSPFVCHKGLNFRNAHYHPWLLTRTMPTMHRFVVPVLRNVNNEQEQHTAGGLLKVTVNVERPRGGDERKECKRRRETRLSEPLWFTCGSLQGVPLPSSVFVPWRIPVNEIGWEIP